MNKYYARVGWPVNEKRLEPALVSATIAPIGLFIFGNSHLLSNRAREKTDSDFWLAAWTSRASVHWIGSMIGVTLFVAANFATLRASFLYQNLVSVLT